ncbi:Gfo/Idh/MocA family protein [Paenibacillus sp. J2TS4]|uniref:Gfo/Idh/MocA family protein n=1 Tax=Paenibacillus sp. J2TS4 TaxID=2807194 RepID=UPI001B2CFF5A|nr:Gfo/Idh/MocA family oxidoreductase [Paenibacillus sp. J2TS4]GIP34795.1 deoxyfructose oxidoreductase [Paenibacillus sp. J2TS4]
MSNRKLQWGIMGCAGIAIRSVIPGIQTSARGEVAAIASRDEAKARETADKLGIAKAYGSYEALLADDSIDAVYIPLPNNMHKEWTIRAAEAGKHVLCEKPFALDARESEEMTEACAKAGVHLAEAFMYRHHPRYEHLREIIAAGEIGELRGVHGTFTFNSSANTTNFRNNPAMGGGALYDIGVYPISAARLVTGLEPEAATVHAFFSERHGGVDMMASGLLEFPGGIGLTFDCAMWAAGRNTLEILGTDGRIEVPSAFVCDPGTPSVFYVIAKGERKEVEFPPVNQYSLQADDFAATVLDGAASVFDPQDAVLNMRVVDACLESARTRSRVSIPHK